MPDVSEGAAEAPRPILFIRDFIGFEGGHLKVADYLAHAGASAFVRPVLYQTPRSRGVAGNPFDAFAGETVDRPQPFPAYFVAGLDWAVLDEAGIATDGAPVFNFVQGARHANAGTPLHAYLSRPAIRICVSDPVAEAIRPHANGPVHVIDNGIALPAVPRAARPPDRPPRIFIGARKNPAVGEAVAAAVAAALGTAADLATAPMPRGDFLARLAEASVAVLLPLAQEGFFLPPLEAMALGCVAIVPDCLGNRGFCRPGENCLMPAYEAVALGEAAIAVARDAGLRARLAAGGRVTAAHHSLARERAAFHALLAHYLGPRS